jgi:hypothetical protein
LGQGWGQWVTGDREREGSYLVRRDVTELLSVPACVRVRVTVSPCVAASPCVTVCHRASLCQSTRRGRGSTGAVLPPLASPPQTPAHPSLMRGAPAVSVQFADSLDNSGQIARKGVFCGAAHVKTPGGRSVSPTAVNQARSSGASRCLGDGCSVSVLFSCVFASTCLLGCFVTLRTQ